MSDINLSISSSSNVLTTTGANDEIYLSLSSETNVVTTAIQTNNTLSINTVGSVTPTSILNLTDVNAGSITDGQVLVYDSSTQTFIAGDITGVTDHGALTGLSDDDHLQYPPITSGTFALDTIPARIGAIHVDPATDRVFVGKGSSTFLDWIILTADTDTSLSDTDQVLTGNRLIDLNSKTLEIYDGDNEFTSIFPVRIHSHRFRVNGNDIQVGYYNALDGTATAGSIKFFPKDNIIGESNGLTGYASAQLERAAGLDGILTLANLEGTGGLMLSGAQTAGIKGVFIANDGSVDFRAYGSGTFTGTAAKLLAVDSSGNVIEENVVSAGLGNLVEDTTPQLGGDLDAQSNNITNLGTLNGTAASTIISGGAAGATALQDVVDDTTPQLGGDLDAQSNNITNLGSLNGTAASKIISRSLTVACSDETSDLTTGTAKATFRMPEAATITGVRASVTTAPAGSVLTVDINEAGTSILSTKLTIDAGEKTSTTAATAAVISDTSVADDAEMTVDIDGVGSSTAGAGLKVTIYYTPA